MWLLVYPLFIFVFFLFFFKRETYYLFTTGRYYCQCKWCSSMGCVVRGALSDRISKDRINPTSDLSRFAIRIDILRHRCNLYRHIIRRIKQDSGLRRCRVLSQGSRNHRRVRRSTRPPYVRRASTSSCILPMALNRMVNSREGNGAWTFVGGSGQKCKVPRGRRRVFCRPVCTRDRTVERHTLRRWAFVLFRSGTIFLVFSSTGLVLL